MMLMMQFRYEDNTGFFSKKKSFFSRIIMQLSTLELKDTLLETFFQGGSTSQTPIG